MCKVFISGSMSIKHLDEPIHEKINTIIKSNYEIILGDANGVDASVQSMLDSVMYKNVTVYCSGNAPRNNLGNWDLRIIEAHSKPGTRAFFTAKDVVMAEDCDYGLMVWDAKSTGTLKNVVELLNRKKSSWVYTNKSKKFLKIKHPDDAKELFSLMSKSALTKATDTLNMFTHFGFVELQSALF